jgi:hypothetical protein
MKKMALLALLTSTAVFAGRTNVIFPQVTNLGSSVQVTLWNHTDRNVTCSGLVNMTYGNGVRSSESVFEYIPPNITSYRTYYGQQFGERIVHVDHSIFCR